MAKDSLTISSHRRLGLISVRVVSVRLISVGGIMCSGNIGLQHRRFGGVRKTNHRQKQGWGSYRYVCATGPPFHLLQNGTTRHDNKRTRGQIPRGFFYHSITTDTHTSTRTTDTSLEYKHRTAEDWTGLDRTRQGKTRVKWAESFHPSRRPSMLRTMLESRPSNLVRKNSLLGITSRKVDREKFMWEKGNQMACWW